jgi:hypothetical protein
VLVTVQARDAAEVDHCAKLASVQAHDVSRN